MMHANNYVYYGIILDKLDAHTLAINNGYSDINNLANAYKMDCQVVGNFLFSHSIVLGKEINNDYGTNVMEIKKDDNGIVFVSKFSLGKEEEVIVERDLNIDIESINNKIISLGLTIKPEYYIITNSM